MAKRNDGDALTGWGFKQCHILVIGDYMLDEYVTGQADRISPEAPVPIVRVNHTTVQLGGAGNVVNNLYALGIVFGSTVSAMGIRGWDDSGAMIKRRIAIMRNHCNDLMLSDPLKITTKKVRVVANGQQVVRFDFETPCPIYGQKVNDFLCLLKKGINYYDAILISDYNKGVLTLDFLVEIQKIAAKHSVPMIVDPKGMDLKKYGKAKVITPNEKEAMDAARYCGVDIGNNVAKVGSRLLNSIEAESLIITCGSLGAWVFERGKGRINGTLLRARAKRVYDVSGAGDTFLAVLGYGLACGLATLEAARIANAASGVVVGKPGTAPILPSELIGVLRNH